MLLLMKVRSGRQLLELCCRERFLVSMLASKSLIFFDFILLASTFSFRVLLV